MKRFPFILLCLLALNASAVDVRVDLKTMVRGNVQNRPVSITNALSVTTNGIIPANIYRTNSGSSGVFYMSNMIGGITYTLEVEMPLVKSSVRFTPPETNVLVAAADYTGEITNNASGSVAYSQGAANNRFIEDPLTQTNGQFLTWNGSAWVPTNGVSGSGSGDVTTAQLNLAVGNLGTNSTNFARSIGLALTNYVNDLGAQTSADLADLQDSINTQILGTNTALLLRIGTLGTNATNYARSVGAAATNLVDTLFNAGRTNTLTVYSNIDLTLAGNPPWLRWYWSSTNEYSLGDVINDSVVLNYIRNTQTLQAYRLQPLGLTSSRVAVIGAGGLLESSGVTTTELGYLGGLTDIVQDQIDSLNSEVDALTGAASGISTNSGSGTNNYFVAPTITNATSIHTTGRLSAATLLVDQLNVSTVLASNLTSGKLLTVGDDNIITNVNIGSGLSLSSGTLSATASGSGGGRGSSNVVVSSTNEVYLSWSESSEFRVYLLTNANITFTNINGISNLHGYVFFQQDTNGSRTVRLRNAHGLIQTNESLAVSTSANALDLLEVKQSFFPTNLLAWWPKDFQPRVAFTNSLASGGGGGGSFTTNTWASGVSSPSTGTQSSGERGIKIVVGASDIAVTQLGTWFTSGTYADVVVNLRDSSCNVLATATVPDTGATDNAFNWAPTLNSPVTLTAGGTYYITRDISGFNEWTSGTLTTDAAASVTDNADDTCSNAQGVNAANNFRYYVP